MLEQFNSPHPPIPSQNNTKTNDRNKQNTCCMLHSPQSSACSSTLFTCNRCLWYLDICPWILQQHAFLGLCRVEKKPNIKSIPFHVNPRVLRTSKPYLTSCKACSIDNEKGKCRARDWEIVFAYLN